MDIGDIFKVPKLPVSGGKRKLPDNPTPEFLKRLKMDPPTPPYQDEFSSGLTKSVSIEGVEDRDAVQNPDFAPGGDADYFVEEDDEGRFFGGGLTSEQKEILNIFDSAGIEGIPDTSDTLSTTSIRRILLRLERAINKNQDQRSKYPDDPSRFIDSEADLDSSIKSLLPLAQDPILAYPELIRCGTISQLIGLFTHENLDIVIDVVELIHELTDDDAGNELTDDQSVENAEVALKFLIDELLKNSILELLVDNLSRLNEAEESDRQGVFHILGIFENILGFNPDLSSTLVSKTGILTWLLNRIQAKASDDNRSYAAELLSIILHDSAGNRLALGKVDGIEALLKVLSQYRRKDPLDADETEFMENVFDALCSSLSEPAIKKLFLLAEGSDLMILMMKEKKQSKSRSIKTLDHAMSGASGSIVCEAFIEALGLKTLFSAFMGKTNKKNNANALLPASEDIAHILGIISSLFSNLASDSHGRIRLLAKFVEGDYEKIDKLLDIRESAHARLRQTDADIEAEKKDLVSQKQEVSSEEENAWYLQRLENGLFTLQTVDYILAWAIMEDDGIRTHALRMLNRKNQSLRDIVSSLHIYLENIDDASVSQGSGPDQPVSQKEILQGLITSLTSEEF